MVTVPSVLTVTQPVTALGPTALGVVRTAARVSLARFGARPVNRPRAATPAATLKVTVSAPADAPRKWRRDIPADVAVAARSLDASAV